MVMIMVLVRIISIMIIITALPISLANADIRFKDTRSFRLRVRFCPGSGGCGAKGVGARLQLDLSTYLPLQSSSYSRTWLFLLEGERDPGMVSDFYWEDDGIQRKEQQWSL